MLSIRAPRQYCTLCPVLRYPGLGKRCGPFRRSLLDSHGDLLTNGGYDSGVSRSKWSASTMAAILTARLRAVKAGQMKAGQALPWQAAGRTSCIPEHPSSKKRDPAKKAGSIPERLRWIRPDRREAYAADAAMEGAWPYGPAATACGRSGGPGRAQSRATSVLRPP